MKLVARKTLFNNGEREIALRSFLLALALYDSFYVYIVRGLVRRNWCPSFGW